jgi:hypothetical protein
MRHKSNIKKCRIAGMFKSPPSLGGNFTLKAFEDYSSQAVAHGAKGINGKTRYQRCIPKPNLQQQVLQEHKLQVNKAPAQNIAKY